MQIAPKYDPSQVEDKWYAHWLKHKFFEAKPEEGKPAYTIVIPPPNVTGVLHMGHLLNNTLQDVLIRRARMQGMAACWVPGTDHASIATEAKVVRQLREQGIKKTDIGRDKFLEHAFAWKEKYGGIILNQLQKLGASCAWDRTRFTMDEGYYKAVIRVFVDLYKKGYIYRGLRMINWDPEAQTALSNEEVLYKEEGEISKLYHVRYRIAGAENEWVTIATTRPETILADTAIAVNPEDERYAHLRGKKACVPFTDREVPIIFDDYVEKEFGTGCLKVTPAHDTNDYEIGQRHDLEVLDMFNPNGTVAEAAGRYVGEDRFVARKHIVKDLEEAEQLVKVEEITNKVGRSERTGAVVEPRLSLQWFVKMEEITKPALDAVNKGEVKIHPEKFINTYRHWLENVRDWCISRQLWWGHRIPAWYFGEGENDFVVAENAIEALKMAQTLRPEITAEDLKQDEDVLDTWASSWLWPLAVFDGFEDGNFDFESGKIKLENTKELDYFYPTATLVTGPDILFFWVARMIIAGYEYTGKPPFTDVFLTGIVRDEKRRKMSKSLGNSPDALELLAEFGADGVRTGLMLSTSAGNDLLFDKKLCEQGRNFANKVWNALRLIKGWEVEEKPMGTSDLLAVNWMRQKLNFTLKEVEKQFAQFRVSDALMLIYKLIWDDFCSWYLEMVKPPYQKPIGSAVLEATVGIFEDLMKILHPFMPFLTEEIWHTLRERNAEDCITVANYPKAEGEESPQILQEAEQIFELISQLRNIRTQQGLPNREEIEVHLKTENQALYANWAGQIQKLAGAKELVFTKEKPAQSVGFVLKNDECFVPVELDVEAEREKLQAEIKRLQGFLKGVEKKLSNERFVSNAPEAVVAKEKQKQSDAQNKIEALEKQMAEL